MCMFVHKSRCRWDVRSQTWSAFVHQSISFMHSIAPTSALPYIDITRVCGRRASAKMMYNLIFLIRTLSQLNRSSGRFTLATLGSIVQNGEFSAGIEHLVSVLYNVDFPTFGIPTIPTFRCDEKRPNAGFSTSTSFFFGGILQLCQLSLSLSLSTLSNLLPLSLLLFLTP